ncbi:uncharacterized protein LOC133818042 [Humulus lupulus]|uniref:uncharacterized protein LOC133818042 n=1 Tax=Humulus lupulus TaxID=3486 RepID=UPI002B40172F|nr:uncharacterized protein LOC133818042 [Humulus lupulus]
MAEPVSKSSTSMVRNRVSPAATTITDMNVDSLSQCASFLNLQDVSNMAMTCNYFKKVAYADPVWRRLYREHWHREIPAAVSQKLGARDAYLARRKSVLQFQFSDPTGFDTYTDSKSVDHVMLDKDTIIYSQGPWIRKTQINTPSLTRGSTVMLNGHTARITCMRLFSVNETPLFRREGQSEEKFIVTSSNDHSIRLWWKGSCHKCFRGHQGPVTALSDQLLGDGVGNILASGGEDGTVRLWSLNAGAKRGQHALQATLCGHEKTVKLMSVAKHKPSLLVTVSKDSKVRVWDTTVSTAVRSSSCVGMISVPGTPVNIKCHEAMLLIASGSSVTVIDLRTMQRVITAATHQSKLCSFEALPVQYLICAGSKDKAMLWDVRRNHVRRNSEPIAELDGHHGPVNLLHMDQYKVVTAGRKDAAVNVWEATAGIQTNSLLCEYGDDENAAPNGCSALAVDKTRIVTASYGHGNGLMRFRDFYQATYPMYEPDESLIASKFWNSEFHSDNSDDEEVGGANFAV